MIARALVFLYAFGLAVALLYETPLPLAIGP